MAYGVCRLALWFVAADARAWSTWRATGGDALPCHVIVMCGQGVSGCTA